MRARLVTVLVTWPFVTSLALLVLNDWYLKRAHPSSVTGILSDFAGISVVGLLLLYEACTPMPGTREGEDPARAGYVAAPFKRSE